MSRKFFSMTYDRLQRFAVVYFSGDPGIWEMAWKNTQSLGPKINFWLLNPGKPPHDPLNHSKSSRVFIFVLPVQLWGQTVIIFLWWWFFPKKCTIDLSRMLKEWKTIRLAWKFASILSLTRAFKIAMKLDNWWRSFFDLPYS